MFDIFGIRHRREEKRKQEEAERLALAQEKKRLYQERREKICKWMDSYEDRLSKEAHAEFEKEIEEAAKVNSTCPKCHSKDVINLIHRTKGELHGKIDGSSSTSHYGGLFSSSSHSHSNTHGEIDGELDTHPVNKCKACGHEWQIVDPEYQGYDNAFSYYDSISPTQLYHRLDGYLTATFDPYDVKENFNSLEEKRNAEVEYARKSHWLDTYRTAPRYMIEYALYGALTQFHFRCHDADTLFNYHDEDDHYSYTMSDELWEITKNMLDWKGEEE